ncbi:hypothetical protein NC653_036367 [Populus alba x Populus x berolinensis]|uniref:Uncharacterized protein n=1 Tax=Populus alba x Populus x berolinensis TaxID=444605 RepID=A0AAD6LJN6_9ROSI|nr:hypothetical protein NC653_036367 [Populus alba x Populus x berolinensis]
MKGSSDNATTPESKEVLMEKSILTWYQEQGYIISACPIRPEWKQGSLSYLHWISSNHQVSSKPWYFDSVAFNHMTNIVPLSNVRNYDGSLKINNTDGSSCRTCAAARRSSTPTLREGVWRKLPGTVLMLAAADAAGVVVAVLAVREPVSVAFHCGARERVTRRLVGHWARQQGAAPLISAGCAAGFWEQPAIIGVGL